MSQIVPFRSEGGNTKTPRIYQISPSIRWCFTLNNYTEHEISSIVPIFRSHCRLAIFGKEIAETGTPHLQGYLEFKKKSRPKSIFGIDRIHWEKAKGNKQSNIVYCSKEDKNPFCHNIDWQKHRPVDIIDDTRLYDWQIEILELIEERPDDRKIHWFWSHDGGIGKTHFCKYLTMKKGAICLHGKGADVRNGVVDFYNKQGYTPNLIVFPIPRSYDTDYLSYEALENIKDMYFYSGKYEGGQICGNCPHLLVFANCPPNISKMSEDRWRVVELKGNKKGEEILIEDIEL